jgi:uncharacterized membrane protein (DUF2068 family)
MERQRGAGVLIAIAVFKLMKAAALIAIGVGALRLGHDGDAHATLGRWIDDLRIDPNNRLFNHVVARISGLDRRKLEEVGIGTFVYAGVFLVEGTGLALRKHWAEYLTTIVTGSFIPLEVFEMIRKPSIPKAIGILVNVLIVAYLALRLRRERHERGSGRAVRQPVS